ncbi:MAG: hypothetical protein WCT04_15865 [Planctomycetota bacterium]
MTRKDATFLYCNRCRMTTSHGVAGSAHTCKRCGTIKIADGIKHRVKPVEHVPTSSEQTGLWN